MSQGPVPDLPVFVHGPSDGKDRPIAPWSLAGLVALLPLLTAACGDGATGPAPAPNRAPLASGSVPALTASVGETGTVDLAGYFTDPDGDALTFTVASSNAATASVAVSGSVVTVMAVARGMATVTVTATDPEGLSAQQDFEVTVPNRAPVAVDTLPAQAAFVGDTVRVGVASSFTDPDGDSLSFAAVSSDSSVATVRIAGTAIVITAEASGSATVTVTASDPGGLSAQEGLEIDVRDRPTPTITHVEPAVLVEGETATIIGSGFLPSPFRNNVSVGGLPATVLSSAETRLSISIPKADCLPPREVVLRVSNLGGSDSVTIGATPLAGEDLNWDRFDWRHTSARDGCIHLPGSAQGGEYLIGVTSVSEDPSRLVPVTVAGIPGNARILASTGSRTTQARRVAYSRYAAPLVSSSRRVVGSPSVASDGLQDARGAREPLSGDWFAGHAEAMARNQALVRELGPPDWTAGSSAEVSARSSMAEGDTVTLNVGCCYGRVEAEVRLVGDNVVWLDDLANPAGTFTDAELAELETFYSNHARPVYEDYFGGLSDVDGNDRILVLMTIEMNRAGIGGVVEFCDLYPQAQCERSNEAEIFYAWVPDPDGTVGQSWLKEHVLRTYPRLLIHEVTHLVQANASVFGEAPAWAGEPIKWPWELEGAASMAQELVGHRLFGHASGQNLGYTEWRVGEPQWYGWVPGLFGFFSGSSHRPDRIRGAPEQCSWLTFRYRDGNDTPCQGPLVGHFSSLLLRFAMDRWGGQYPGGEKALVKRMTQSPLRGFASLVDVSPGWSVERILGEFYATLWLEGSAGLDTPGMTSWDIHDVVSRFDDDLWLKPYTSTEVSPSVSARVRAGSTLYFHWAPDGPLRPTSFKAEPAGQGPFFIWAIRTR